MSTRTHKCSDVLCHCVSKKYPGERNGATYFNPNSARGKKYKTGVCAKAYRNNVSKYENYVSNSKKHILFNPKNKKINAEKKMRLNRLESILRKRKYRETTDNTYNFEHKNKKQRLLVDVSSNNEFHEQYTCMDDGNTINCQFCAKLENTMCGFCVSMKEFTSTTSMVRRSFRYESRNMDNWGDMYVIVCKYFKWEDVSTGKHHPLHKIGMTINRNDRIKDLNKQHTGKPGINVYKNILRVFDYTFFERFAHHHFRERCTLIPGEKRGAREWFEITKEECDQMVEYLKQLPGTVSQDPFIIDAINNKLLESN